MNFKKLFSNDSDRAVSPVIGVILMVAITVILAAVIGAFVLGQADELNETAPNVTFDYSSEDDTITITHAGGNDFASDNVQVQVNGDDEGTWSEETVSTGNSVDISAESENDVRIVWSAPEGGSSDTIGTYTVP